jgi:hypothetical protein
MFLVRRGPFEPAAIFALLHWVVNDVLNVYADPTKRQFWPLALKKSRTESFFAVFMQDQSKSPARKPGF